MRRQHEVITFGFDSHKHTTAAAVDSHTAHTGGFIGHAPVASDADGRRRLIDWVGALDLGRWFALEDCRHVSERLEREFLARGERLRFLSGARKLPESTCQRRRGT
jgi:transposase